MKNNHRSSALEISALHLLHRAGQCAEVLFTNETGKADLTPRQYAILASVAQNPDISQTGLVEQTGVDRSTLAIGAPFIIKELGLSLTQMGLLSSAFLWAYAGAQLPAGVAVQGNLDPFLLSTTPEIVAGETSRILREMRGRTGHIFNLGHGVPPDAKLENIESLVAAVRSFR